MPNLRHPGTGQDFIQQVLAKGGSRVQQITKQAQTRSPKSQKISAPLPTKSGTQFSKPKKP